MFVFCIMDKTISKQLQSMDTNQLLKTLYYYPETGFLGIERFYHKVKQFNPNIKLKDVETFLNSQPSYQLTKPYNKNKIKVRYSPCTQLLSTDNIDVKDSNLFDGNYGVKIVQPCVLLLDIGQEYTSNAASNTAYFKLHTNCSDRAFYNLGEDLHAIADTASTGAQGLFSGLFGSIPWSTIFLVVMFILAIWLAFGAFKALKGS